MGYLVTLGLLTALAVLPLGIRIAYGAEGFGLKVVLGPLKLTLIPRQKKEPEGKASREKTQKIPEKNREPDNLPKPPQPPKQPKPKKQEAGGSLADFLPLVKVGLDLLNDIRRKLRLEELYLRLILASSDPCDLAVSYGKTWAAVGNLMPVLERIFVIKNKDVEVECDFTASETKVVARLEITITLGRLLGLAAVYGVRALKEFIQLRNKRKGGAEK